MELEKRAIERYRLQLIEEYNTELEAKESGADFLTYNAAVLAFVAY